jgi:hypothetical protein
MRSFRRPDKPQLKAMKNERRRVPSPSTLLAVPGCGPMTGIHIALARQTIVREGDFVFVDLPYAVKHNLDGFLKYSDRLFSRKDQVRLTLACQAAAGRGAKLMIMNANHESIRDLYAGLGNSSPAKRYTPLEPRAVRNKSVAPAGPALYRQRHTACSREGTE